MGTILSGAANYLERIPGMYWISVVVVVVSALSLAGNFYVLHHVLKGMGG